VTKNKKADSVVKVDRREEKGKDRREESVAVAVDRRKTPRRRQIDPTTCERDYTDDEVEFMHALDDYKRSSGRMFPTCSEILEVIRDLGYSRGSTENNENSKPLFEGVANSELEEAFE